MPTAVEQDHLAHAGQTRTEGLWLELWLLTVLFAPLFLHSPGFYLISPSEFERFSLSARNITEPLCSLDIYWPRDSAHARCMEG